MMQFLFAEEKCFACTLSLFVFLSTRIFVYRVFHFAAEAGMKDDISFLGAPDA